LGQSATHGGGIIYNGDGSPAFAGSTVDAISFYRTEGSVHHEVFKYNYNSDDVTFNGDIHTLKAIKIDNRWTLNSGGNSGQFTIKDKNSKLVFVHDEDDNWTSMYINNKTALRLTNDNGHKYASYDGDNNWDYYSDRRLKKNIVNEEKILDRIMKLNVVNYDYIDEDARKHKEIGFIAQEVEPYFPSLVSQRPDDRYDFDVKSLGYSSFGILAVGAVRELKQEKDEQVAALQEKNQSVVASVQELDKENRRLNSQVETLNSQVETLKSEMEVLKVRLANSTTQEDRIAKLEELVSKTGQGE
jgi:hypothetical protein